LPAGRPGTCSAIRIGPAMKAHGAWMCLLLVQQEVLRDQPAEFCAGVEM
jgi:hypothetical protein